MLPNSIRKMIEDTEKQCDDIIAAYSSLIETNKANKSAAVTLSMQDLVELNMMVTRTHIFAMKLSIGHRDSSATAMDDKNFSIRLQRFSQTLQEIHDFYAKEH